VTPRRLPPLDLTVPGRYHVVGSGGPGMSAIALVLAEMGHRVSGSDIREIPVLDRLRAAGVEIHVGHRREQVHGVDAVTYPSGIPERNIELDEARRLGIPTLHRSALLASICGVATAVGVAGAHGKTSTSSMLAMILSEAGLRPSFVIGGDVNDVGTGARWAGGAPGAEGARPLLVIEADESDRTFLELPLHATVVTNVEADFLDNYGGEMANLVAAFDQYLDGVEGPKVVCLDDREAAGLAARHPVITYGTHADARYRAVAVGAADGALRFTLTRDGDELGEVRLPLRGVHMARNATAALAMAMELGAPFDAAARALGRFGGVARRFDVQGRHDGVTFVDDYAHLPSEIDAVLEAAATSGDPWTRVVAVFQPNRYSRIARLAPDYRDAFARADVAIVTDIYPSGEQPLPGVTGELVVQAVRAAHPELDVRWVPRRPELIEHLAAELRPGDVCISMGCGDVASLPAELLARLARWPGAAP
jgi:UDP-N-acetylmuramate--alanine ligase